MDPSPTRHASRWTVIVVAAVLAFVALYLVRKARSDPRTPFLPEADGAQWITFARAPSTFVRAGVELETTFVREFELAHVPHSAELRVRLRERGEVLVNGRAVVLDADARASWKRAAACDVAQLLQPGVNEIELRARTAFGPAAVWATLECDGQRIASDSTWRASCAGSAERPVRLATEPMSAWSTPSTGSAMGALASTELNPTPLNGLSERRGTLAACATIAIALVIALGRVVRRAPAHFGARSVAAVVAVAAAAGAALFWHNRELSIEAGFDARAHVEYVDHMRATWSVPFADEGWEMYQPPLYYALAAGALQLAGFEQLDASSVHVVRALQWLAWVAQIACIAASMRLLFGERPKVALAGSVFGALLPMPLYLYQYPTNEALAATCVSAALLCALRIAQREQASWTDHLWLGVALGAGLLTKFSAALALAVIFGVLGARHVVRREFSPHVWLRGLGVSALAVLALCGWYYAAVFQRFGKLFVWNNDPLSGLAWWQDPGLHTAGDFARFGAALRRPLFSSLDSVLDAAYSTMWGDGMLGGSGRIDLRPPWDYQLNAANMLLALVPTLALLVGLAVSSARFFRAPRTADWILLGTPAATLAAWTALNLDVPFWAQAKAVYASSVVVPLCVFAALGFDALARAARRAEAALWSLALTVALAGCAPFFSRERLLNTPLDESAPVRAAWAERERAATSSDERSPADLPELERRAQRAGDSPEAWSALSAARRSGGDLEGAIRDARTALAIDPHSAAAHYALGIAHYFAKDESLSLEQLRLAHELAPTEAAFAIDGANLLAKAGRVPEALAVLERTQAESARRGLELPEKFAQSLARMRERAKSR
ncbi:MAG: glycosyltransferase family 39 protein [Planctomycetes bacterium]|nr:glycosyltransferase family 39 protein [Planctomycetota bacterium]